MVNQTRICHSRHEAIDFAARFERHYIIVCFALGRFDCCSQKGLQSTPEGESEFRWKVEQFCEKRRYWQINIKLLCCNKNLTCISVFGLLILWNKNLIMIQTIRNIICRPRKRWLINATFKLVTLARKHWNPIRGPPLNPKPQTVCEQIAWDN